MENKVIDLLLKIKERPGMFLGTKSLSNLRIFTVGYLSAMEHEIELKSFGKIYIFFNEWLKKNNVVNTIFCECSLTNVSNFDAFDMFY